MIPKIEKLVNQKIKPEDYDKFINSVYKKMDKESGCEPTFKECITIIKKLYRLIIGISSSKYHKHMKFKETRGRNHTWIRRGIWHINTEYPSWRDIIHKVSHWIEYQKHDVSRPHTLQQFRIEKECVEYAYKHKWHMGTLKRETKPKVVIDKNVLMIKRLTNNILKKESKLKTTIKRTETLLKKDRKKLRYYEKKLNQVSE
tara:strand:- start:12 stop:614 length:603 start_codon:yes stop_codon:yes gene_type:complete